MPKFALQVEQSFNCTYIVEADTANQAIDRLYDPSYLESAEFQQPGEILTPPAEIEPEECP